MQPPAELSAIVEPLHTAESFEEAAALGLAPMADILESTLAASAWAGSAKLLRALLHLRPDGGYRGLFDFDVATRRLRPLEPDSQLLPSASAWVLVREVRRPVLIDVALGNLTTLDGRSAGLTTVLKAGDPRGLASQARLLRRGATHVLALPLRMPGGNLLGMISLEAECRQAMGSSFIWPDCQRALQSLADLLSPFLAALPLAPREALISSPLVPVVGAAMAPIVKMLEVFARQGETLLISGGTGSGKSKLAKAIHQISPRSARPFEVVDLLSLPEETQLPELFGWRRGAFTGAVKDHEGCVARAEGGTLFIDEIDKLSMRAQAGLLTLLEERTYRPMGSTGTSMLADVRFLVGTNVDLFKAVEAGTFREDLFYRINILPVRLPSLAQRADEICAWSQLMLNRRHQESRGLGSVSLTSEAQLLLTRAPWPGNLRQLDNVLRRSYSFALVDAGGVYQNLVIGLEQVERALAFEGRATSKGIAIRLEGAASRFLDEILTAPDRLAELEKAGVFRAFVLVAAIHHFGSETEAFRALGRVKAVESRNHRRILKREMASIKSFLNAMGEPPGPQVAGLIK